MANGKTHDDVTIWVSRGLIAIGAVSLAYWHGLPFLASVGATLGLWISPDLDLPKCKARRRWKEIGYGWIWEPYEKLLPHRSWLSHFPIVGTSLRLAYLGWPVALAYHFSLIDISIVPVEWPVAIATGLYIADVGHWVLDGFPGLGSRKKNSKFRGNYGRTRS